MDLIDNEYYNMQVNEGVEDYIVDQRKKQMPRMEQIICDEDRENLVVGKAMIVAYSRKAAYMMYKEILEQRPSWNNKVKMVMTRNNQDCEEMAKLIGTKKTQREREDK